MPIFMKRRRTDNSQTALNLFTSLQKNIKCKGNDKKYQNILSILRTAIKRIQHQQQTPELEARFVYQNICTTCFVDKIVLSDDDNLILKKIDSLSHSKGIWGEMNTLSIANTWGSK